jgi:hypothetical protein
MSNHKHTAYQSIQVDGKGEKGSPVSHIAVMKFINPYMIPSNEPRHISYRLAHTLAQSNRT